MDRTEYQDFDAFATLEAEPEPVNEMDHGSRWPTLFVLIGMSLISIYAIPVEYSSFAYAISGFTLAMFLFLLADSGLFGHFDTMEALRRNEHGEVGFFILGLFVLIAAVVSRA